MTYRAVNKQAGDCRTLFESAWIGWLVDLPGVNAQEWTKEKTLESLRIGAEDLLATDIPFGPGAVMTTIDVPPQNWAGVATSK